MMVQIIMLTFLLNGIIPITKTSLFSQSVQKSEGRCPGDWTAIIFKDQRPFQYCYDE